MYYVKGSSSFTYIKKYRSPYYYWWTNGIGGAGSALLKLVNGELRPFRCFYEANDSMTPPITREYFVGTGGRDTWAKVSQTYYEKMVNKYVVGMEYYKFTDNTAANRNTI